MDYLLNKPAAAFRSIQLINDTLFVEGFAAEEFSPNAVKYTVTKFALDGTPLQTFSEQHIVEMDYWLSNGIVNLSGNVIAVGSLGNNGGFLLELMPNGIVVFYKEYFDSIAWSFNFKKVIQLRDSSYVVVGSTSPFGNSIEVNLLRINKKGEEIWRKKIDQTSLIDLSTGVFELINGNIMVGSSRGNFSANNKSSSNTHLVEVDTAGNIISTWTDSTYKTYGPTSYIQLTNGDAIYTTLWLDTSISFSGNVYSQICKGYIVREDSTHNKLWELKIGQASSIPSLKQLKKLNDGNYLAVGGTYDSTYVDGQPYKNTGWLIKFNENGNVIWQRRYFKTTDMPGQINYLYDFVELENGDIVACGELIDGFTDYPQRGWLLRLDSYGCLIPGCENVGIKNYIADQFSISLYPNPTSDLLYTSVNAPINEQESLSIKIITILGKEIQSLPHVSIQTTYILDTEKFETGLYLINLYCRDKLIRTTKFIKL